MPIRRIIVIDPESTDPTWGSLEEARVVEVPSNWDGDNLRDIIRTSSAAGGVLVPLLQPEPVKS